MVAHVEPRVDHTATGYRMSSHLETWEFLVLDRHTRICYRSAVGYVRRPIVDLDAMD